MAQVTFAEEAGGVKVSVTFDAEDENPAEMQQAGWQAILDNFARYVTSKIVKNKES
jgi:hypothetical protein